MTPNAYLCAHCDHHENVHGRNYCRVMNGCDCTGFTPGAAAALLDAEYPDRLCAWCLYPRSSPECNFGTGHRYQEYFA